ncbi:hypothetical protein [Jeotgalibacillus malaysiensis]|uniref:hypothetical protein n=1 Tax=Jeotgalibacillus malaysiensis TaxID=1508404 RepID=UPI00384A89FE
MQIIDHLWKVSPSHYALYIDDRKLMKSIERYYFKKGFTVHATYHYLQGKLKATQYAVPVEHLNAAKRLARKNISINKKLSVTNLAS